MEKLIGSRGSFSLGKRTTKAYMSASLREGECEGVVRAYWGRAISAFDSKPASWQKVLPKEGT